MNEIKFLETILEKIKKMENDFDKGLIEVDLEHRIYWLKKRGKNE